jgi:hypothetical protein
MRAEAASVTATGLGTIEFVVLPVLVLALAVSLWNLFPVTGKVLELWHFRW